MNIIQYLGRGVYHEDNGIPCQDRARYLYAPNGNIILALSDGCSSARFAETAAEINVDTVIRLFSEMTLQDFLSRDPTAGVIIDPILEEMKKKEPKHFKKDPYDFSATLLFAVTDGSDILTGHIGDGNILCVNRDGAEAYYSEEENAGASDRTFFTVSDNAKAHLRLTRLRARNVRNILLYSDGPQKMLWYQGDKDIKNAALALTKRVRRGEITDCAGLAEALAGMTSDSMYQLMDDWSMLILDADQAQCDDLRFDPVSMKQRFMRDFSKNNEGTEA